MKDLAKADHFLLTLKCHDQHGVVSAISTLLFENKFNIVESAQFSDPDSQTFFMRLEISGPAKTDIHTLSDIIKPLAARFSMWWEVVPYLWCPRVILMVSKQDHCLNDLLYRWKTGQLRMKITRVISNHEKSRALVEREGLRYDHYPVNKDTKPEQEAKLREAFEEDKIDFVVLARYMQILSNKLSLDYAGRVINIHHSFLPGFKGARPYHRAHERGVKLMGATAHYVTPDLDEGPIIEQEVERVHHAMSVSDLIRSGQDIERRVLAKAISYHIDRKVLINERKTVVFR